MSKEEAIERLRDAISNERRYWHKVEVSPNDIAELIATVTAAEPPKRRPTHQVTVEDARAALEAEEQRRIEQAYIDGSVEGSPIDHDGDLISGEVTRYGAVPAAETCYCHDHPKGHPMTDHAEWARSTGASDEDRERRVHEAIERIVENELTGVPRWRFDLTRRLARAALDAGAGVSPSTGWKPATAKGTAIGEDEWGRPLHVWTGSPSTGDPERTYAWRPDYGPDGLPETALPERVVVAENGAYWRDYGSHYSMCPVSDDNDPVAVRAVYTPSTGDDRLREAAQALSEALWSNEDRSLTQPAERHALDALRAALGEENA
jgi:hypothetical protein